MSKLSDAIADGGHKVTVFQPFHFEMKNAKGLIRNKQTEIINYYPENFEELSKMKTETFPIFWDSKLISNPVFEAIIMPGLMGGLFNNTAHKVIRDTKLHGELRAKKFDVVIHEPFELTGVYLANILKVPHIPVLSMVRLHLVESLFGNPSPLGYIPEGGSTMAPRAGLLDRLNDIVKLHCSYITMSRMCGEQVRYLETALGKQLPNWRTLVADAPLMIANSNPYLDYAVPSTANIVRIGGMTMDLEKLSKVEALPEEYENILKERDSTVLISFGSVIRSFEMPDYFKAGIIKMFEKLSNVTFIWKYEEDDVEFQKRLPKNVHLKKWVPQPALLADKRLKVFVTHGGLGSTMELAYTGKTALMVPIFGDQPHNAQMLARHGGAVAYDKFDLADGDKLAAVVNDLVTNPKYQENAHTLLEVLRNQPTDPKEELLKKLEFAIKFPKFRSLNPALSTVGFIQFYYLDALAVIAVHVKFISKLADIIADRGHDVTLIQPFHNALKNTEGLVKNKNITILNYYPDHYEELTKTETQTFPLFWDSGIMNNAILQIVTLPYVLGATFKKTATQLLRDENLLEDLKKRQFDVVIAETFELTGVYLAHLLEIPCIPIMSTVRFPIYNKLFGQPSLTGYVPQVGSELAQQAGFFDRLNDVYRNFCGDIAQEWFNKYQNDFIQEAIGKPVPFWKDLVKQSPVYITNSNPYLDFAVPTTATVVHVGGITMDLQKMRKVGQVPEEYESILREKDSTVLISFGSFIRSYEMPEAFKAGLIKMFENLPNITFIWKYEKDDEEFKKRLPSNVHLKKWVPSLLFLLTKVKVFVTHGGLGSTMEVAYSGKPSLMVPIFGDQTNNAQMLARHGGAVAYDKFELQDGEKLTAAMNDMVSNPKYERNAKILLDVLTNQPIDPTTNLINHLEFAIKFPNLRSQVPEISDAGFIAYHYVDVIVFLLLVAAAGAYLFSRLIRRISIRIMSKKPKSD
ncbi:unnamed protein product [Caenorhabditis sp. 36 PRJEB53466]|nr:unnamed protein product [Caenorhabditis sp. 36 PRJEB53466]